MNPLKKAYLNGGSAPPAAATSPVVAPVASAASSAPSAPAVVQTTQIPPAAGGLRDLSSLRAKLAGGFVNPPEAPEAVNEGTLDARTVETPDGGAQAAPGWVEAKNGLVVRAPVESANTQPSEPGSAAAPPAELTRGQKAAATRAANKKAAQPSTDAPADAAGPSVTVRQADVEDACRTIENLKEQRVLGLQGYHTDELLAEIYKRVAVRFA